MTIDYIIPKDEYLKLRRELDFYKAQVEPVDEDNRRLRERWKEALAENAKLRELCADMYEYAKMLGYDHPLLRELGVLDE